VVSCVHASSYLAWSFRFLHIVIVVISFVCFAPVKLAVTIISEITYNLSLGILNQLAELCAMNGHDSSLESCSVSVVIRVGSV